MSTPATTPTAPAQVECPQCSQPVPYYDAINSAYFGCPHCHTLFEYGETGPPKKLRKFTQMPALKLTLPIGSIGELEGTHYRVVGYTLRKEARTPARWEEYVLWNEAAGIYHQLAVFEGHWMLIEPTTEQFVVRPGGAAQQPFIETAEDTFRLYNRYSPRILYAVGEFDWNVLQDEKLNIQEYISPPCMLIAEQGGSNTIPWFMGRHVEPVAIQNGFHIPNSRIPAQAGVGAVQPPPGGANWRLLQNFTLLMALLVVATHLFLLFWGNDPVLHEEFVSGPSSAPLAQVASGGSDRTMQISPSFTVPGTGALEIRLWADVDNNWVELPFSLVNEQTGQLFEVSRGVEYYHGVEGGESWSEGSSETTAALNSVPAGHYHLNFYPAADANNQSAIRFRATVWARASFGSNAFLALLVLLLYPGILYARRYYHEQQRWESSDYAPVPES